jgi:hypothetical protein
MNENLSNLRLGLLHFLVVILDRLILHGNFRVVSIMKKNLNVRMYYLYYLFDFNEFYFVVFDY